MISVPYEVKKALRDGMLRKNYRFVVLYENGTTDFTIDNNTLVSESVNIDERMCSGDTLKFGLCEGSSLEFQYFGKPNITGRRVQVFVDVEYEKVITEYVWETQASFNNYYTISGMSGDCRLYSERSNAWEFVYVRENGVETQVYPTPSASGTIIELGDVTGRTLMVTLDIMPAPSAQLQLLIPHTGPQIFTYSIPMGFFDVKKCSRQASTGIIKATCYNKLQSEYLDAKANEMLLSEIVDPFIQMTIYSIRKTLLEGFQIEPYINKALDPEHIGEGRPNMIVKSIKLGDLTDDSGPINYYSLSAAAARYGKTVTANTTFNIYLTTKSVAWDINPKAAPFFNNKICQYIQTIHDFGNLTKLFADYLTQFLDDCSLSKTGREIVNGIKNVQASWTGSVSQGWKSIFGIQLVDGNNVILKSFNDYAYIYQNDGTYKVDGAIDDLTKQIITPELTETREYKLYIPTLLWVDMVEGGSTYSLMNLQIMGENPIPYIGAGGETKTYDQFKYEDGTNIPIDEDFPLSDWFNLYEIIGLSEADLIKVDPATIPEFTLRDISSASYETVCQFGQLSRLTDLFSGVELNHSRLYPADTLYPATDLYPDGAALSGFKSMYSKLWADEGNVHKWRYLIITYKGLDEDQQEEEYTLQRTVNADGTDDYNMSDNWLFRNLIWTAEQVGEYADAMVAKMQDVTWFPFEMWCAGLPYIETGDEIEIPLNGESYTSYVLQRQLKGIQNLQDTYINGTLDIF